MQARRNAYIKFGGPANRISNRICLENCSNANTIGLVSTYMEGHMTANACCVCCWHDEKKSYFWHQKL